MAELKCAKPKTWDPSGTHKAEIAKAWPLRYPSNTDSIGIEIVGLFDVKANQYESVTVEQNASLAWLIKELQVSYKQPPEASTAKW